MVEHNQSSYYNNGYKFNGKELDEATGMYYYGARYYDPRISIFISVDPLAEKYPNIGGYVYCANNPILFVDPDGKELIFWGKQSAISKTLSTINSSLGGNYAKIVDGKVRLNISQSDIGNMSESQRGFYNIINQVVEHSATVEIGVAESSKFIIIGSLNKSKIDIDDINNLGTDGLINSTTVLGHEIHEQFQYQALGNKDGSNSKGTGAHDIASDIESTMNGGWNRIGYEKHNESFSDSTEKNQLGGGEISGKTRSYKAFFIFQKNKNIKKESFTVKDGNIKP